MREASLDCRFCIQARVGASLFSSSRIPGKAEYIPNKDSAICSVLGDTGERLRASDNEWYRVIPKHPGSSDTPWKILWPGLKTAKSRRKSSIFITPAGEVPPDYDKHVCKEKKSIFVLNPSLGDLRKWSLKSGSCVSMMSSHGPHC